MFHYTIVFLNGDEKEVIADTWKLSGDCEWFVFYVGNQEILRVNGNDVRMMERKII